MNKLRSQAVGLVLLAGVVAAGQGTRSSGLAEFIQQLPVLEEPAPEFLKGPYVQNVTPSSVVIMWQSADSLAGLVAYGPSEALGDTIRERAARTLHEVKIEDLRPDASYYYRVISGGRASEMGSFRTAVPRGEAFSFAVYGDSQNGPFPHRAISERVLQRRPHFVLRTGDLVERGSVEKQWDLIYFRPAARLIRHAAVFAALGNHEHHARQFFDYFSLPGNEQWYSFDYGNAHFVALDSDLRYLREGSEQIHWLEKDLAASRADWKIVFFHHPPFTASMRYYTADRLARQRLLHPILEKYDVDLVFSGHDHNYERTRPIVSRGGRQPVTYVVCGNGGAKMRYIRTREWTAHAERTHGFVLVEVEGLRLRLEAWSVDGRKMDELVIDKSDSARWREYCRSAVIHETIADPDSVIRLMEKADDLRDEDNWAEAIPYFKRAYRADTTCVEALAGLAECYAGMDSIAKAVSLAMLAIAKEPNLPDPYEVLVEVHTRLGQFDQALDWAMRWSKVEPDVPDAYQAMAEVHEKQARYRSALNALRRALQIWPSEADLYFELAKICEKLGDREAALAAYRRGLWWYWEESENDAVRRARERVQKLGLRSQ
jgi:tetratricopeptide (TPR) repeat protein